jgi:hypothetical protein
MSKNIPDQFKKNKHIKNINLKTVILAILTAITLIVLIFIVQGILEGCAFGKVRFFKQTPSETCAYFGSKEKPTPLQYGTVQRIRSNTQGFYEEIAIGVGNFQYGLINTSATIWLTSKKSSTPPLTVKIKQGSVVEYNGYTITVLDLDNYSTLLNIAK